MTSIWKRLRSIFTHPKRDLDAVQFSLGDRDPRQTSAAPPELRKPPAPDGEDKGEPIPEDLDKAVERLAAILHYPLSQDLVFREVTLPTKPTARARVIYYEGLADSRRVEREIIEPLMRFPLTNKTPKARLADVFLESILPSGSSRRVQSMEQLVTGITMGEAAILIETGVACLADVKEPPSRTPEQPITERTTRGPQMAFVESHRTNSAMIRRFVHDPDLVLEGYELGRRHKTPVALLYISDIANPKLVAEVRQRIRSLDVDGIMAIGILEQLIEDHPVSLVPTMLNTERPDRAALHLLQGSVVLLSDGTPRCLIAPVTFSTFLHSPEDVYQRYPYATFLRVVRLFAALVALLAPAIYIAILNYHSEMLPHLLLVTLESARQTIPFPLIISVLFMEVAFEVVREAGVRVPTAIAPTIGIVGALLIGDMAVRASFVSPATIMVVAATGLANFAVPDHAASFAIRIGRFLFIALAGVLGFLGVAIGFYVLATHLASLRSFGVPFLAPIGPSRPGSVDVILRDPYWRQEFRPSFLHPLDLIRLTRRSRAWDPGLESAPSRPESGGQPEKTAGDEQERGE